MGGQWSSEIEGRSLHTGMASSMQKSSVPKSFVHNCRLESLPVRPDLSAIHIKISDAVPDTQSSWITKGNKRSIV